jgi:hypothetical protein
VSWLQVLDFPMEQKTEPRKQRRKYTKPVSHPGRGGRRVQWGHRTYETIRQCADDVGLSIWAVRRRLGLKKDERKRHDIR